MISALRTTCKLAGFLWISARALVDFQLSVRKKGDSLPLRAAWCHRWGKAYVRLLNVELKWKGSPPANGLLTCNHLSYLDIVILSAVRPQIFLSKAEVKNWPIIGALTRCAGTLFVRRDRKGDVAELQKSFTEVVEQGLPISLFPEGTSSDGSRVLPFYSSLLEPAVKAGWNVTPGWIGYRLDEGNVADEVCYWRDMTFAPHFFKLLSKKKIYATIVYGEPIEAGLNRKEMAAALHAEVSELARRHREPAETDVVVETEELTVESAVG